MIYNILFTFLFLSILIIIVLIFIYKDQIKRIQELSHKKITLENLKKQEIKEYFEKEWNDEEKKLENKLHTKRENLEKEWKLESQKYQSQLSILNNEIKKFDSILEEKEKRYSEVNQDLELYRKGKLREIDSAVVEYEQRKRLIVDAGIVQYRELRTRSFNQELDRLKEEKESNLEELNQIKSELEEERSKRATINEEIRRAKEVEEQRDFYRIQLDPNDKNDVEILREIAPRLRHPEVINKVIWNGYYQKPLAELRKRLLPNGDKAGIYKITRLKTGEVYIGQTKSFDTRFVSHVKTALGVGNLASSQLHRSMALDGPEQYIIEILEEDIPVDKLRKRESYYINFYDSKNYGLNSVTGDKNK